MTQEELKQKIFESMKISNQEEIFFYKSVWVHRFGIDSLPSNSEYEEYLKREPKTNFKIESENELGLNDRKIKANDSIKEEQNIEKSKPYDNNFDHHISSDFLKEKETENIFEESESESNLKKNYFESESKEKTDSKKYINQPIDKDEDLKEIKPPPPPSINNLRRWIQ